jgi:hypothetical protein
MHDRPKPGGFHSDSSREQAVPQLPSHHVPSQLPAGSRWSGRSRESAIARSRALRETVHLSCLHGCGETLQLLSYLTSVHDARLPRVTVADFQERPAGSTLRNESSSIRGSPALVRGRSLMVTLASLVAVCQPRQVFEFGTCEGASTWHLWANAPPDASITTLDLPPNTSVAGSTDLDLQGLRSRAMLPNDPRVRLIEQDSRTWTPDVHDVDFWFHRRRP